MAQLFAGERLLLAASSAPHRSARDAELFVRGICSSLPMADVYEVPTLAERMEAAKEKQARIVRLQDAVFRQAREDQWTHGDWSNFLAGFEDERYETDLADEGRWGYDDEEPSPADPLTWEVQKEVGRPQAALLRGRVPVFSTAGLSPTEDVEALIEWCRTDAVTKAPVEQA
jgi:hypothetical protein